MSSSFQKMLLDIRRCTESSNSLYENISRLPRLSEKVVFLPNNTEIFTFRLQFVRPSGCTKKFYGLSISYPIDANRSEINPSTIETALLGRPIGGTVENSDLVYVEDCGYYDICRFNNSSELVDEIIRLSEYISSA
jgi:hypothetical protein